MPEFSAVHDGERAGDSPIMSSAPRVCRKCGAEIFADAPEGLCTACLFETGLNLLAHESVAGIAGPKRQDGQRAPNEKKTLRSAKTLADFGDYELLEVIGRGGQGVVYRARQKSLNRIVALKVIGLGHWASDAHLKRFRREAEAAARLDHPGIVPIYEIGERDGSCYFSMKFVEGGQLDEVSKREPMSMRRAVELIAKVARIVHYAHEHGILHRDIKPGNILLDQKLEPHLTDFGLARLVETESTVTRTMEVLGTPSYMAPEQAVGNNEAVSSVTDVYGLGAVLYQLLTCQPPFAGGTTYETIKLLLDTEPRQPRALNAKIDRDLSTICLKCLEKDPKRRYSSALALAEDLEHWLKHEPIRARRTGVFIRGRKWVRRNPSIAVMAAMLLALAVPLTVMIWKTESVWPAPSTGIAVLPFKNLTEGGENAYFADGIQDEILTRLSKIADLKVISRTSTQHYKSAPENLSEIGRQLGVAHILEGTVQKRADSVRVNVQLIKAANESHVWADTFDRKLTDIFSVESEVAKAIADQLQAKLTGQEEQVIAAKPTNNPEAYDAYLRGLAFETRASPPREAAGFYERAVQLDPGFAVAWARLSRADALLYFVAEDQTAARRDAAKKALENAQKLQPSSPETQLALGYYQYLVLRDYEVAKRIFKQLRKLLPGSSEVLEALAVVTRREGNWDESVAFLEQGLVLDPRNTGLLSDAAETYAVLRQFPAALKFCDRALDITPNDSELMARKAGLYQAQGNLQEAAKLLSEVNPQTPNSFSFYIKIRQLRFERNYVEAVRLLQARLAQFHFPSEIGKGYTQATLAMAERIASDSAGAKATAEQARNTLEALGKDQPDSWVLAALLAQAYAVLGEKNSALKEAERSIMLLPNVKDRMQGPAREENLALILMMVSENSRAISTLAQLLETPYRSWLYVATPITPALLRLDPIWDPLRSDPRFQKLAGAPAPK